MVIAQLRPGHAVARCQAVLYRSVRTNPPQQTLEHGLLPLNSRPGKCGFAGLTVPTFDTSSAWPKGDPDG